VSSYARGREWKLTPEKAGDGRVTLSLGGDLNIAGLEPADLAALARLLLEALGWESHDA
jgi:hypothetical protein